MCDLHLPDYFCLIIFIILWWFFLNFPLNFCQIWEPVEYDFIQFVYQIFKVLKKPASHKIHINIWPSEQWKYCYLITFAHLNITVNFEQVNPTEL